MCMTARAALVAATTAGLLVPAMPVQAQQTEWTGATSSDWFDAGNWDDGVPTESVAAVLDVIVPNPTLINGGAAVSGPCVVGRFGTGSLAITKGGTLSCAGAGFIGQQPSGEGTVTVSGAGSTWSNDDIAVGADGMGTLRIEDGGTVDTADLGLIGANADSVGRVTVTGDGSTWTVDNGVVGGFPGAAGAGGTGTLTVADGGAVIAVNGTVLAFSDADSSVIGTVNIGAAPGDAPAAPGTLTTAILGFSRGTATLNFNHTESDYAFAPTLISGTPAEGHQVNVLAGTTRMTGDSSDFAGTTRIEGATLQVEGILGGTIEVQSGGRLAGNGTVGAITNTGTVAPGDSIGTLHVSADYAHAAAGTFEVEIEPGGSADLLDIAGTANLAGGTVSVSLAPGDYAIGSQFPILTAAEGISGTFDTLVQDDPDVALELAQEGDTVFLVVVEEKLAFSPAALAVDPEPLISDGNDVFEPGERVVTAPAWRNGGGSPQFLDGIASDFTGPDGPDYTLVADAADYGEIAPGEVGSCQTTGSCYEMEIGPEGVPRPVPHWDAVFEETLPDETAKTWTLHLGDSFTDVPRASPFYSAVETLLHNGIDGDPQLALRDLLVLGCGDAEFCPTLPSTRAQTAVFLLEGLEGGAFEPDPCVPDGERFVDVPASSPFCPWVEELARREVTAGCGADRYCPEESVTRAQVTVLLLKTLHGADHEPPECEGVFEDVTCPSLFTDWIEELFNAGFTAGCGVDPLRFCPDGEVTRAQMAAFVVKAFGLVLYGP